MPESCTPRPSSVNATAPWATMSPISESTSPLSPCVSAPDTSTRQKPTSEALRCTYSTMVALSQTGFVFGIAHTAVKPPCAAAFVSDSMSPLYSNPGSRK